MTWSPSGSESATSGASATWSLSSSSSTWSGPSGTRCSPGQFKVRKTASRKSNNSRGCSASSSLVTGLITIQSRSAWPLKITQGSLSMWRSNRTPRSSSIWCSINSRRGLAGGSSLSRASSAARCPTSSPARAAATFARERSSSITCLSLWIASKLSKSRWTILSRARS